MLSFKWPEKADLGTRWKLAAVALGGAAGIVGAYMYLTT